MHALIIEDDYLIGHVLEDHLRELGFASFSFARSQDGAIAAAKDKHPDLITADVKLLPGDGVEAVRMICTGRKCAVVYVTGYAEDLEARVPNAIAVGKPVDPGKLKEAVTAALSRFKGGAGN